ncbi:hypothetical protein PDE_07017 [Penicillium oxalicum 114-2]|uniref:Uncharacterized protein n=1 Tax=Penicillium oxalicum (strain 114-2 / CGMCC 5302) TaxID=933388 RepID=S8B010_PENO1|nr:hypothetical protein PDE_07017 [Penicillium oxalicum 114-2]
MTLASAQPRRLYFTSPNILLFFPTPPTEFFFNLIPRRPSVGRDPHLDDGRVSTGDARMRVKRMMTSLCWSLLFSTDDEFLCTLVIVTLLSSTPFLSLLPPPPSDLSLLFRFFIPQTSFSSSAPRTAEG